MSTIRVVNLQHTDATEPNIVLLADGTAVFASGITISGGTNLTVSGTAEFASGTVSAPGVTFIDDNNTGLYSPAADTVAITTAATERVRVDNAGNVGIGTTSPATALEVQSASNTSIRIDNEDDSTATLVFHNTGSTDRQISVTAGAMKFGGSSDEQMRIDSSGKVGIGTSSPSNILHIKNDSPTIRLESSASSYVGRNSIGQFQNGLYIECDNDNAIANSFTAFNVDGTERLRIDSSGNLSFSQEASSSPYPEQKLKWSNDSTTANGFYISQGTDRNGKIWHEQGLDIQFATNNIERMRIDSNGKLVVGATSFISGANGFTQAMISGSVGGLIINSTNTSATSYCRLMFTPNGHITGNEGMIRYNTNDYHMAFWTQGNERMRIQNNGRVLIGKTATNFAVQGLELRENGEMTLTRQGDLITTRRLVSEGTHVSLRNISGTTVGTIVTTSSSTAYNTSSDYRLKENIVNIADGITRVKQLQPKRFNFTADDTLTVDGFIAHEAQTVVPEAITGEKDGEEMQGIDQSKLVPLLTAALQEAIAKIETLETKVAALEAG
jgi:hypothetical protein